jgi:Na+/H+-dicarboxylate symporter
MSRAPRLAGYALMAAAALLALAMRRAGLEAVGPFSAVAVALFAGMIGVMLVFTDLMVRGLYAQIDAVKRGTDVEADEKAPPL